MKYLKHKICVFQEFTIYLKYIERYTYKTVSYYSEPNYKPRITEGQMGQYLCSLINHVVVTGLRIKASRDRYKINELRAALSRRHAATAAKATGKVLQQKILSFPPRPTAQSEEQSRNEEGIQESERKSWYVGKQVSLGMRD